MQKYLRPTCSKRGRPKQAAKENSSQRAPSSSDYLDQLYQKRKISFEQHLASVYYRTLYHQVHRSIGSPELACRDLSSLSHRFGPQRFFFTPEEKEEWYEKKAKQWKRLRSELTQLPFLSLSFLDDVILYKRTDPYGLSKQQFWMVDQALTQIAHFFGMI